MKKQLSKPPQIKSVKHLKKTTSSKLIIPFFILSVIFFLAYLFVSQTEEYKVLRAKQAYNVFHKGMYDSSKVLIDILKKNPFAQLNDSVYLLEANYFIKKGDTKKAIQALEKGTQLVDSMYTDRLFFKLGKLQLKNDNPVSALDDFFSGLVVSPTHDSSWYYCGYIQAAHTNDYKNAIKSFEQAISLNPEYKFSFKVLLWKGIAYQKIDQQERALNQFNQAIKLTTDNDLARYYKAKSLFIIGDTTKACNDWETLKSEEFELAKFALDAYCN